MKKIEEYKTPEFLFCEIVPKDGTFNDHRVWIYCTQALSLIEFVCMTNVEEHIFDKKRFAGDFHYIEDFQAFWIQNNCEAVGRDEEKILQGAWKYYLDYMKWEDENIGENFNSKLN